MVVSQGEIWWANMRTPIGSEPGYIRPVVIIQSDSFNHSRLNTVIVAVLTSNLKRLSAPGNVALSKTQSTLPKDSVVNVSQIIALDKSQLLENVGKISDSKLRQIQNGLRLVFDLE